MKPRLTGYLRTVVTLGALSLLVVLAVTRGLDAVSKPFPKREDPPVCVETSTAAGDFLRAGEITVSVINAGDRTGLAGTTLTDLEAQGFDRGELANLADPDVRSAQIWTTDGRTPAVRLVRTYLGGNVQVIERPSSVAGITVVVGDQFPGVRKGKFQVKVRAAGSVCGPAALN